MSGPRFVYDIGMRSVGFEVLASFRRGHPAAIHPIFFRMPDGSWHANVGSQTEGMADDGQMIVTSKGKPPVSGE